MAGYEYFRVALQDAVATVTFDRAPVNAVSAPVYTELAALSRELGESDEVHVVILTAPVTRKAWCGGADLHDFLKLDSASRRDRYAHINACLPLFANLPKPVIAAITGHAVGVGMVLASLCDIRIAAEEAFFALPEIERGTVAGGGGFFSRLGVPQGLIREMLFTGRRFTARELERSGLFNDIVPKAEVLPKAQALARMIAGKSLPALRANKEAALIAETTSWQDAYAAAQEFAAELTGMQDSKEGIRSFLERRNPSYEGR
jgi:enoyl-CoA hydratase/carnithine racemase